MWLICLLVAVGTGAKASWASVDELQQVLQNGCKEWVKKDGRLGRQTREAYQRCRQQYGVSTANPHAFIETLWDRKKALMLLHQVGYLRGRYDLGNPGMIASALERASEELGIKPALKLRPSDIERLYQWYLTHPPKGSLAEALQKNHLPAGGLDIYVRVFKREEDLEVFARPAGQDRPFVYLKTFPVMASTFTYPAGGNPSRAGPKSVIGDFKVPEGCYNLTLQKKWSRFHLGYLVSYPNPGDMIRSRSWGSRRSLGHSIVLHGDAVTEGCIPMGHFGIEEIFLLLSQNWNREQEYGMIHLFPCRFGGAENEKVLQQYGKKRPQLAEFWNSLRPIHAFFEKHRQLPQIGYDRRTGYYTMNPVTVVSELRLLPSKISRNPFEEMILLPAAEGIGLSPNPSRKETP